MSYKSSYYSREERQKFLYQNFRDYLKGKVLDVGCDKKTLATFLADVEYIGVDLFGNPDIKCNLEKDLPFPDSSFDTVVCIDVLEHLENIHSLFDEICRVSRKYVIISLPNALSLPHIIYFLSGTTYSGKYGLNVKRPMDRHRWVFTIYQAKNFIHKRGRKNDFKVSKDFYFYRAQGKMKYVNKLMKNLNLLPHLFADAYWCLLERMR
jgi:2-polyprenyl-3-methyl-5-hydroxy-6-metoxy-1,4-benzoquinol methylase